MRLNLAQALMSRSDLMLLDEPTNHLDLDAVVWLERWLAGYRGTLLLVSHDRDFLDGTVTHVAHLERGALTLYTGNYTAFETQRAARLAVQQAMYEKQQREIAHMTQLRRAVPRQGDARRGRRRAGSRRWTGWSTSRRRTSIAPFDFEFPEPAARAGSAADARRRDARLRRPRRAAQRAAVAAPGRAPRPARPERRGQVDADQAARRRADPLLAGRRVAGHGLEIGYFAQHQLEQLRGDDRRCGT